MDHDDRVADGVDRRDRPDRQCRDEMAGRVMEQLDQVDVFTAEIIRNGSAVCAYEMGRTLARTAHSTLLYDVQDFGVGVVGADGSVWGETPGITIFTGCLPEVIRSAIIKFGAAGFEDG